MHVMHVGVSVHEGLVTVQMRMRKLRQLLGRVLVLVVLVVLVVVRVLQRFMPVSVLVPVRGEQQGTRRHRPQGDHAPESDRLVEKSPREQGGEARREGEQRPGLEHAEVTKPTHEENDRKTE